MTSSFVYRDTTNAGRDELNNNRDLYFGSESAGSPEKIIKKKGKVVKIIPAVPAGKLPAAKTLDLQYIDERTLTAQDVSGYKIKGQRPMSFPPVIFFVKQATMPYLPNSGKTGMGQKMGL